MSTHVFLDFDGTVTTRDIGAALLQHYTDHAWKIVENKYREGLLTMRQCLAEEWRLVNATVAELAQEARRFVDIREGFHEFLEFLSQKRVSISILSDGLDVYVRRTVTEELEKLPSSSRPNVVVYCNELYEDGEGLKLRHPTSCEHGCALCKIGFVQESLASKTIYIGDGISDMKAAVHADHAFAVKGSHLASYLEQHETEVDWYEFKNFHELREHPIWDTA